MTHENMQYIYTYRYNNTRQVRRHPPSTQLQRSSHEASGGKIGYQSQAIVSKGTPRHPVGVHFCYNGIPHRSPLRWHSSAAI